MKEYIRTELTITEFDAEDVITTSGVPSDPQNRVIQRENPVYTNGRKDSNWLPWLQ